MVRSISGILSLAELLFMVGVNFLINESKHFGQGIIRGIEFNCGSNMFGGVGEVFGLKVSDGEVGVVTPVIGLQCDRNYMFIDGIVKEADGAPFVARSSRDRLAEVAFLRRTRAAHVLAAARPLVVWS